MSSYEQLGQDDLSIRHALAQGAHDAISTALQYTSLGLLAIAGAAVVIGPKRAEALLKRLTGGN